MCPDFESRHFCILDSKALEVFNDGETNNNFMVLYKTIIPNYLKKNYFYSAFQEEEFQTAPKLLKLSMLPLCPTSKAVVS